MQKTSQGTFMQKLYGWKLSSIWSRRIIFIGLFTCILLYYIIPYVFENVLSGFSYGSRAQSCMTKHLAGSKVDVGNYDAVINYLPLSVHENENVQIPFVGNGKIGAVVSYDKASYYLIYEGDNKQKYEDYEVDHHLLNLPLDLTIRLQHVDGSASKHESMVLNYRHGIVEYLTCYSLARFTGGCVFINHTLVAHRSRPNVFLQHIEVTVEGRKSSTHKQDVYLNQEMAKSNSAFKELPKQLNTKFRLYGATLKADNGFVAVVAAITNIPNVLHVHDGYSHVDSISVIMHSAVLKTSSNSQLIVSKLADKVSQYANDVLSVSIDKLLQEHKNAWSDILHTGLTISTSLSHEPGIPSPWAVNSTLYSVLSTMDSKLHDKDIPEKERFDLMKRLQTPEFCYNNIPTVHNTLWKQPGDIKEIIEMTRVWSLKLRKSGCGYLVSEGAEGMLQAMVLSFGHLQFTRYDLQLHADPDILHNRIAFRGVMYKNNTIDIAIHDDKGSSHIQVSLRDSTQLPIYMCEAGCISPAVRISKQPQLIPVYITRPHTPILYLSDDKKHLDELKRTLHVNRRIDHAQHMEEKLNGGLPFLFWFSIGSLIILFHLFLIRMIFKEYYSTLATPSSNKTYYSNRGRLAS